MRDLFRFLSVLFNDLYWLLYRPRHWYRNVITGAHDDEHLFDDQDVCKICHKLKEDCYGAKRL